MKIHIEKQVLIMLMLALFRLHSTMTISASRKARIGKDTSFNFLGHVRGLLCLGAEVKTAVLSSASMWPGEAGMGQMQR